MTALNLIRPEFVNLIPKDLKDGVLYISKEFSTAAHRCCCGCGTKIVTPLRATEYRLFERGHLVSLHPSIGNWNHPCQSHYWIRDNRVVWAGPMTKDEIRAGRRWDAAEKDTYYGSKSHPWWRRASRTVLDWLNRTLGS